MQIMPELINFALSNMKEQENKIKEEQENDNLYIYSEEDIEADTESIAIEANKYKDLDNSGPNFSQADGWKDGDNPGKGDNGEGAKDVSPFLLMLKVLFNPVEGWKTVRRSGMKAEQMQQGCFYPLLGILSACQFANLFYSSRASVSGVLVDALIVFVSFFFGYFCIMLILKTIPSALESEKESDFAKVFVTLCLSTLCLFFSVIELLPMLWAVLIFLPLWTIYIICKGVRFFRFPESRHIAYTTMLSLMIVGVPCVIDWILKEILPK